MSLRVLVLIFLFHHHPPPESPPPVSPNHHEALSMRPYVRLEPVQGPDRPLPLP